MVWFSATENERSEVRERGGVGGNTMGMVRLSELPNSLATPTVMLAPPTLSMLVTESMGMTPVTSPRELMEMCDFSESGDVWR